MAKQSFETRCKKLFASFAKGNKLAHDLAIEAAVHFGQHGDTSMLERFTAMAFGHQSHFRYQAFKAWLEHFLPVKVGEPGKDKDTLTVTVDKKREKFTAEQLAAAKATPFYDYMPEDKPLSAPKIGESLEITLARGLNTGTITEQDIINYAASLLAKAKKKQTDAKVVEWSVKFLEQQTKAA